MVVPNQVTLAADIVAPAHQMGIDNRAWDETLQGLIALIPDEPGEATMSLDSLKGNLFDTVALHYSSASQGHSERNSVWAEVKVCRSSAGQAVGSALANIEGITLKLLFNDIEVAETLAWDALRAIVDSPHMHPLCIDHIGPVDRDFEAAKRILCSVLRRTQLTWALESGKLQFRDRISNADLATSEDILSVPTEQTIDDITVTLDIAEQAEWLLRLVHSRFEQNTREHYLRKLVRTCTRDVSTNIASKTAPSTADSAQNATV
ncbi:uncharacterized protein PHACADRAFT_202555 [Phanerochaete carnosa HHB-10118-sp]|uniref:Uncharacterized protein n=1 Tax=Phanerochaete carnosa (strain HHB-10118-sp) TaxID=650164 RepID=K5VPK5_PHACS|nr:uncharacterized protein PHACADRAFT_202555 [Phanerochaete carnosa HHB-10118-sp]EKM48655.1 hypothetical protein PHACADRAFT_202555 [Phanerochaete carnosa HHB-10118-sp]